MAKLTLPDIITGYGLKQTFNDNNALIEAALENTLSLDGTAPNAMTADLDLNNNDILNAGDGTFANVTVTSTLTIDGSDMAAIVTAAELAQTNAETAETNAGTQAGLAAASATNAANSEIAAGLSEAAAAQSAIDAAAAIGEGANILSTGVTDGYVLTAVGDNSSAWEALPNSALSDLTDVVSATNTDKYALMANGTTGYVGRALLEADISDLGTYLTSVVAGDIDAEASTDGYILTSDGAGNAAWEAAAAGGADVTANETVTGSWTFNSITPLTLGANANASNRVDCLSGANKDFWIYFNGEASLNYGGSLGYNGTSDCFELRAHNGSATGNVGVSMNRSNAGLVTFPSGIDMVDAIIDGATLLDYRMLARALSLATANAYTTAQVVTIALSGNGTLGTPTAPPASGYLGEMTYIFTQDGTGGHTVAWPASFKWPGGVAGVVDATANAVSVVHIMTVNGGTTWLCNLVNDYS